MATTQNTYTGNGSTTNYSFTFEYLKQADVKVTLDTVATTAFTFANATTLSFTTAPANGVAIRIFRDTAIDTLSSTFFAGSAIKAEDLNQNFTQSLYVTQESETSVDISDTTANAAKATAEGAVTTANSAVTTANTASTNASAAVTTANTASTTAASAVTTANTASTDATTAINTANAATTTANGAVTTANSAAADATTAVTTANSAVTTANSAVTTANSAVTTANTASTNASAAVTTANTASTNASTAVTTANTASTNATTAINTANGAVTTANAANATATAASAAVSNAVLFTLIANVAAIPGSPSNNDYIEIGDSTGIESFSPLSGLPSGFVGASGLTVRLRYDSSASSWVFMNYFANDSETRYLTKNIPVVTGDATNGSGQITLNCEVNTHGVKIKGPPHSAAANYTLTLPNDAGTNGQLLTTNGSGTLTWTTQATDSITEGNTSAEVIDAGSDGRFVVTTEGIERMRIDSSGNLGIGTSAPSELLEIKGVNPQFVINGTSTTDAGIEIQNNGTKFAEIKLNTSAQILDIAHPEASGQISLSTGASGTERLRIDSSGRMLIGTTTAPGFAQADDFTVSRSTDAGITIRSGTAHSATLAFSDGTGGGASEYRGLIQYSHLSNSLAFSTNSVERLRVDSSGNLGIGATSPARKLHVSGSGTQQIRLENTAGTGNAELELKLPSHTLSFGVNSTANYFSDSADLPYVWYHASGERMRIDGSGKVGIGVSSPIFKTDILSGTANTGANVNNPGDLSVTGSNKSLTTGGANVFVSSNSAMAADTGGTLAFTGRSTTSSTSSLVWANMKGAKESAVSTNANGYLAFAVSNHNAGGLAERMRIASAGQIGLGGANYGTSGQVITSNGSGSAPTWQSVPKAGTDNTKMMTPLRVAQAIAAQGGSVIQSIQRGTTTFSNNTVNVSITSVNTSKSFISSSSRGTILTASGSNSRFAASGSATSQLTSSTNVQVVAGTPLTAAAYQYGAIANSGTVTWEVIEFK
jgi:hypothetical protein